MSQNSSNKSNKGTNTGNVANTSAGARGSSNNSGDGSAVNGTSRNTGDEQQVKLCENLAHSHAAHCHSGNDGGQSQGGPKLPPPLPPQYLQAMSSTEVKPRAFCFPSTLAAQGNSSQNSADASVNGLGAASAGAAAATSPPVSSLTIAANTGAGNASRQVNVHATPAVRFRPANAKNGTSSNGNAANGSTTAAPVTDSGANGVLHSGFVPLLAEATIYGPSTSFPPLAQTASAVSMTQSSAVAPLAMGTEKLIGPYPLVAEVLTRSKWEHASNAGNDKNSEQMTVSSRDSGNLHHVTSTASSSASLSVSVGGSTNVGAGVITAAECACFERSGAASMSVALALINNLNVNDAILNSVGTQGNAESGPSVSAATRLATQGYDGFQAAALSLAPQLNFVNAPLAQQQAFVMQQQRNLTVNTPTAWQFVAPQAGSTVYPTDYAARYAGLLHPIHVLYFKLNSLNEETMPARLKL